MPAPATDAPPVLIYLHGFLGSPGSRKASETGLFLSTAGYRCEFYVPQLPPWPKQAMETVLDLARRFENRKLGLIGSSLGGYYANWLSVRLDCRAVLVNPAVYPYRLFRDRMGWHKNPYTGEEFLLDAGHMEALRDLEVGAHPYPGHLLVLLQTGDETLDYRQAQARFSGSPQWIVPGGDHGFQGFPRFLPAAMGFLGILRGA